MKIQVVSLAIIAILSNQSFESIKAIHHEGDEIVDERTEFKPSIGFEKDDTVSVTVGDGLTNHIDKVKHSDDGDDSDSDEENTDKKNISGHEDVRS